MKYNKIANTLKIAAVAALVLGMAPAAKAQATGCTNAMLRGTFVYTFAGFSANPAMGPGAEQFHGHMENTRVFKAIATALGLGQ